MKTNKRKVSHYTARMYFLLRRREIKKQQTQKIK